jgi:hypothetical protein
VQPPDIATLARRLADTPEAFLRSPGGEVDVAAVVADLLWAAQSRTPDLGELASLGASPAAARDNHQRLLLLCAWLLYDPAFRKPELVPAMLALLKSPSLVALAETVDAALFVSDSDRREELARRVVAGVGLVPPGETAAQAEDRLRALDSVERRRVIEAARQAEARAREVRAQMAAKAAAEAAAKVSRE